MARFFPSNWADPREINDPPSELDTQAKRIKWLSRYGIEKSEWADDLPRLANLIKHGTDRIILSMERHISRLGDIQKIRPPVSRPQRNLVKFQDAALDIRKAHENMCSIQSGKDYIVQHQDLAISMQWLFTQLKKENMVLQKELEKIPTDTLSIRLMLNQSIADLEDLFAEIKGFWTRAITIAILSTSVASAGSPQKIISIVSSTQERSTFVMETPSLVSGQMSTILKEKAGPNSGQFFQKFRDNPKMVGVIPEMKSELILPLLKSNFDGKKYQDGAWQEWNLQIVQKLFPRLSTITPENAEIFVHALQSHIGFTKTDGKFWPKTKARLIGYFSKNNKPAKISTGKKISEVNEAKRYPNDAPLASEEDFRERYGSFMEVLGRQLRMASDENIWEPLMMAITAKESTYGQYLKSKTGSTGVMQLTKWPFADMKGETRKAKRRIKNGDLNEDFSKRFDQAKVRAYQEIFQRLDLESLKKTPHGKMGKTSESTLGADIWKALEKIQSGTAMEMSDVIEELERFEKGATKNNYLHSLNLIFGGVYATYIAEAQLKKKRRSGIWTEDILDIAKRYNGDSNQKVRNTYAQGVLNQYRKETRAKI